MGGTYDDDYLYMGISMHSMAWNWCILAGQVHGSRSGQARYILKRRPWERDPTQPFRKAASVLGRSPVRQRCTA